MASEIVACAWSFAGSVETSVRGVHAACSKRRRICARRVRTQILHALLEKHTVTDRDCSSRAEGARSSESTGTPVRALANVCVCAVACSHG